MNKEQSLEDLKQDLSYCLMEGHVFLINLDDSDIKYDSNF